MSRQRTRPRRNTTRPPRQPRPRSCGKRWFKDRISAELALAAIHHHGDDRSEKLPRRAYECPTCKGWHLTSKSPQPYSVRRAAREGERRSVPGPRRVGHRRSEGSEQQRNLRTGQMMRARRSVQGLEPWVVAHVEICLTEQGQGPTWRELEAVFGWGRWEGALIIRYLVDQGWLREEEGSPCLLPGEGPGGS